MSKCQYCTGLKKPPKCCSKIKPALGGGGDGEAYQESYHPVDAGKDKKSPGGGGGAPA